MGVTETSGPFLSQKLKLWRVLWDTSFYVRDECHSDKNVVARLITSLNHASAGTLTVMKLPKILVCHHHIIPIDTSPCCVLLFSMSFRDIHLNFNFLIIHWFLFKFVRLTRSKIMSCVSPFPIFNGKTSKILPLDRCSSQAKIIQLGKGFLHISVNFELYHCERHFSSFPTIIQCP